jgi:4-amino-4-deoxy-L-arabinose transferase-like glycosyltransferase
MVKPLYLILLFLGAVVLYSIGNWSLPLIDRDEPRFAEASREMRQSGDYIVPRLNGDYRLDKPPLIYWCQVLSYNLFGENDFAARFPSAIFAALTAVATLVFGTRIYGARVGVWAGIVFATSLQVFIHARAAVADMPLVFFFLLATWADWERLKSPRAAVWWWTFYLALGLGFLAKGPAALLPALFGPVQRLLTGVPRKISLCSALLGGLVVLGVIGLWGIPALMATNGEYLQVGLGKHVIERSLHPMESHGLPGVVGYLLSLPFYLITTLFSFFPWCLFLPLSVKQLWSERAANENYLLGPILIVFFVFTIIQTKLPHYVLPAYPMLAVLVARQVSESRFRHAVATAVLLLYLLTGLVGFRLIEPEFLSKRIAEEALPIITPETRTASLNYDEQSLIWYLRGKTHPLHRRIDASEFLDFMDQPGPALCVVNKESIDKVYLNPAWKTFDVSGYNFARWKLRPAARFGIRTTLPLPQHLDLVAVIKP